MAAVRCAHAGGEGEGGGNGGASRGRKTNKRVNSYYCRAAVTDVTIRLVGGDRRRGRGGVNQPPRTAAAVHRGKRFLMGVGGQR